MKFVQRNDNFTSEIFPNFGALFVDGHTESMMIPHIQYQGKELIFMADLLPSAGHIPLPYVMGYDTRPLITMTEKEQFLNSTVLKNAFLFFQHDSVNELCTLKETEKGIRLNEAYSFENIFS